MIPIIPADKANHFAYGAAFATVAFVVATQTSVEPWAHMVALAAAIAVGALKELFDFVRNKKNPGTHTVDKLDVLWTAYGGLPVFIAGIFG